MLWRVRLIAFVPVILNLLSTMVLLLLGTLEVGRALANLPTVMRYSLAKHTDLLADTLGGIVTGIDFDLIGIALLIFSDGIDERLISPIEPARHSMGGSGPLDIRNLDPLKEKFGPGVGGGPDRVGVQGDAGAADHRRALAGLVQFWRVHAGPQGCSGHRRSAVSP